jgi:hypothetical protein
MATCPTMAAIPIGTTAIGRASCKSVRRRRQRRLLAEDGSFTLRTYPHGDGAMLGPYKVTISLGRDTSRKLAKYTRQNDTPFHIDVPPEGIADLVLTLRERGEEYTMESI